MKLLIEVRDRTVGNMLSILINGNDVATLSHDQADELANKLLEVTCRLSRSPICETHCCDGSTVYDDRPRPGVCQ